MGAEKLLQCKADGGLSCSRQSSEPDTASSEPILPTNNLTSLLTSDVTLLLEHISSLHFDFKILTEIIRVTQ